MISHTDMIAHLTDAQKDEHDMREKVREAHLFVDKRDGQWEPYWWNANEDKPRYTFDLTNPIIDQISGEMEQADFDINVKPAGGDATKDIAELYDGLIRNIENLSNATNVFNQAGRNMVTSGMDGWRVTQRFVDDDSFDQDLMIETISNFVDRVWFNSGAEKRDKSDATECWVLQGIPLAEYKERWPKGSEESVSQDRWNQAYWNQADLVMVGEYYYITEVDRELVLMNNGAVYEDDDKFKQVSDDLQALGIIEIKRRTRKKKVVHIRRFDGGGWLGESKETVFGYIPVIPTYANFKIVENKTTYWGVVEKLLDPQRVLNYGLSREVAEGALAPRAKYWGTEKQREGHEDTIATLNTNNNPWQDYNADPEAPGAPQMQGGAQINPGLRLISDSMTQMIGQSAGLFSANMGDNPNAQSGVALEKLQNKGDTGTIKYFSAQEIAICHTAKILIDAIPAVYESERQVRILKEDGSFDMTILNQTVIDQQTGQPVQLNDLSVGTYDVTCSAGPSFQNRQQETVTALVEVAQVDPTVIQLGGDILLNNISAPGMNKMAERKRQQLISQGVIPFDQMTDEEQQQAQQMAQQPPQPDPMMVAAEAEMAKAQNEAQQNQSEAQFKMAELQLKNRELDIKQMQLEQKSEEIMLNAQLRAQSDADSELDMAKGISDIQNKNADTAKKMAETEKIAKEMQDEDIMGLLDSMPTDRLIRMLG